MKHEPFENWIFEESRLPADQQKQLKAHTEDCAHCRQLDDAWQSVQREIRNAPAAAPRPGFGARWQASLAQRRELEHRRQARRWIISLSALGFLVFTALIVVFLTTNSPSRLVLTLAQSIFTLASGADRVIQVLTLWLGSISAIEPAALTLIGLGWAGFIAVTFLLFTGRRLYVRKVEK